MAEPEEDIEVLAAKAKAARQDECGKEIQAVLEKHRCEMHVMIHLGERTEPLGNVLNLPVTLALLSK